MTARVVLHLPDVAQLVGEQVVGAPLERRAQQDQVPARVAVEAPQPGQAEEARLNDLLGSESRRLAMLRALAARHSAAKQAGDA